MAHDITRRMAAFVRALQEAKLHDLVNATAIEEGGKHFMSDSEGKKYPLNEKRGTVEMEVAGKKIEISLVDWPYLVQRFDLSAEELESHIDYLRGEFEKDDPSAIMEAISFCCKHALPIPKWAATEFNKLYKLTVWGYLKDNDGALSWNVAFGRPRRWEGRGREDYHSWMREPVWNACMERKERGESLNDATFESVGRELGVGGTTIVKRLYREKKESLEVMAAFVKIQDEEGLSAARKWLVEQQSSD